MKKLFVYILLIGLLSSSLFAEKVNKRNVEKFARNWLKFNSELLSGNQNYSVAQIVKINDSRNQIAWGVNLTPSGFLILSTDKNFKPLLGYSGKGKIEPKFNNDKNFIFNFLKEKKKNSERALLNGIVSLDVIKTNRNEWKKYIEGKGLNILSSPKEIYGPFLTSDWGQGYVGGEPLYNYYTPNHWPAGCVATATAQILNYYKWPIRGMRTHGYTDNNTGYHYADFYNTFYDWANTLDQYENILPTTAERQAAGLLTYHVAVSLNMDFEPGGSTANTFNVPYSLKNYFRYSGHYKSSDEIGFWNELKNNMLDSRPCVIAITGSGVGHAAVVDGYSEANNYYHVNPGWYGDYIGWYNISGDWNMSGYNTVIGAAKGIVPSPMINNEIQQIDSTTFILSWQRSIHENAEYYELQYSANFGGPYSTISSSIADSFYTVTVPTLHSYYYRVRAFRDGIWWDYSYPKKVALGSDLNLTFSVDMSSVTLDDGDEVIIRGNTLPLSGSENSAPLTDDDGNGIYSITLTFGFDNAGDQLIYRFGIQKSGNLLMENENRYYTFGMNTTQILDTVAFNKFTSVEDDFRPSDFVLYQNFPNPFSKGAGGNTTTTIMYSIPNYNEALYSTSSKNVSLVVYNILGQKVATLVNERKTSGIYSVRFNASNLPSGVYIYKLQVGNFVAVKNMILLK